MTRGAARRTLTRVMVITPTVPNGGQAQTITRTRRRRSATGAEQLRRKAWGREWGAVGHAYKIAHANERKP